MKVSGASSRLLANIRLFRRCDYLPLSAMAAVVYWWSDRRMVNHGVPSLCARGWRLDCREQFVVKVNRRLSQRR